LSTVGRLTYQATPKTRRVLLKENKQRDHRELAAGISPETSTLQDMRLSFAGKSSGPPQSPALALGMRACRNTS
jgi:hypothetical protein